MTVELIHGDCLEVLATLADNSVDAFITDPPYPKKYLHLYPGIARECARILKPGGSFLAIVPHYAMPWVYEQVGRHLKYRWTHSMWQASGQHPRMAMGIEVMWKPISWWVKKSWPNGRGFVRDGFANSAPSKDYHKWEQSMDWATFCLTMVHDGGVVVDPCLGGGTMGVACVKAGHPFIGIEIDPVAFAKAQHRIQAAQNEMVQLELGT